MRPQAIAAHARAAVRVGVRGRVGVGVVVVALGLGLAAGCHAPPAIAPSAPRPLPTARVTEIDATPKQRRHLVPPEVFLRAYLTWFGGLAPLAVQAQARPRGLFDAWNDYLSALGLPEYRLDQPRATQSNTLMIATLGRLGEALCARAAEHDLHGGKTPVAQRVVFGFEVAPSPTRAQFAEGFDVLHRTFLGYPSELAPPARIDRFYALYRAVAAHHAKATLLDPDETAWAAVCTALVQHPETELD